MLIQMKSASTGNLNVMELPITAQELQAWEKSGTAVQDYFPHLSDSQREFLLSGVTPQEWAALEEPEWDDEEPASGDN
jgi:hypothetical protein